MQQMIKMHMAKVGVVQPVLIFINHICMPVQYY